MFLNTWLQIVLSYVFNRMNASHIFLISCLSLSIVQSETAISQDLTTREDSLLNVLNALRSATNDSEKDSVNSIFKSYLRSTLELPDAFNYSFSKLKSVGFIDSPDNEIRIVNWNIEQNDQTHTYHGYILKKSKSTVLITELVDKINLADRPDGTIEVSNWYGALYYKIIPKEKGSKKTYVLLGWDGNNSSSTIKVIDVLYFSGNTPKFGSPVFKTGKNLQRRLIFEHSKKVSISLKYEPENDRIIYDHLSPETPSLSGFYMYYIPDLSYDALYFKEGKWILKEDVIGVNKPVSEKNQVYILNERTGKVEKVALKNKWVNPQNELKDPDLSDQTSEDNQTEKLQEEKKIQRAVTKTNKRDTRSPQSLNTTIGSRKSKKTRRNN
jgi:hypothetical protein